MSDARHRGPSKFVPVGMNREAGHEIAVGSNQEYANEATAEDADKIAVLTAR